MNPLKYKPHLFANGKFKVVVGNVSHLIVGMYISPDWERYYQLHDGIDDEAKTHRVNDCTLIARPISDMSDKERIGALNALSGNTIANNEILQTYEESGQAIEYHVGLFLYLLSIGAYPFDQNHFNDGTVLNINEVE